MSRRLTKEEFVTRAKNVHCEKYDYSITQYININTKAKFRCKIENHSDFYKTPRQHLSGQGCPICDNAKKYGMKFITKSKIIHNNNAYDYSIVNYVNRVTKVKIICPRHGIFEQTPESHINGSKCPLCAKANAQLKYTCSPAILYYIRVECSGVTAYKIGITQRSTLKRFFSFSEPNAKISVLMEKKFSKGIDAFDEEQRILKKYSSQKYTGKPLLSAGNSEMFKTNVLGIVPQGQVKTLNEVKRKMEEEYRVAVHEKKEKQWQETKSSIMGFLMLFAVFWGLYLLMNLL